MVPITFFRLFSNFPPAWVDRGVFLPYLLGVKTTKNNSTEANLRTADSCIFYYRCRMADGKVGKVGEWEMEGRKANVLITNCPRRNNFAYTFATAYFVMKDGTVRVIEGIWTETTTRAAWTAFDTLDMTVENARVHYAEKLKKATGKCEFTVPHNQNFK